MMENNTALIEDLRKRLLSRGPELNDFNQKDLDRVQKDDMYLWQFLKQKGYDVDKSLEMMVDCLRWREQFSISSIMERNIDRRLFEIGFLYPRNEDKNGNPLLLFHTKLYKKEQYDLKEVKKLFAFGLEKMVLNNPGKKVTLIFDMQDSGLSNMDMDLIKFVITCFQTYFPNMLEYLIVFETPWILTAAWKIVKTWLSTELISKIKFVNKTEIYQYVNQDQLITTMGGMDEFVYKYPPQLFSLKKSDSPKMRNKYIDSLQPQTKNDVFSSMSLNEDIAGILKSNDEYTVLKNSCNSSVEHSLIKPSEKQPSPKNTTKRDTRNRKDLLETAGPLVTISPVSEVVFCGTSTNEPLQIITITNTVSSPVAFKVKTTSPESFRVRPSSGPIAPGGIIEVHVNLQRGHEASVSKDKFLILSTVIPQEYKTDISSMWKKIPKSSIMEQRLRCRYDYSSSSQSVDSEHESSDDAKLLSRHDPLLIISKHLMEFDNKIDKIQNNVTLLERDIKIMFRLLLLLLLIFFFILLTGVAFVSKDFILTFFL